MLKRLSHHINRSFERLLNQMILSTILFMVVGFGTIWVYAITQNSDFIAILWIIGLIYVVHYFSRALTFGKLVKDLDQESLTDPIYLSKSYFNF